MRRNLDELSFLLGRRLAPGDRRGLGDLVQCVQYPVDLAVLNRSIFVGVPIGATILVIERAYCAAVGQGE